jgi:hypothetical protein
MPPGRSPRRTGGVTHARPHHADPGVLVSAPPRAQVTAELPQDLVLRVLREIESMGSRPSLTWRRLAGFLEQSLPAGPGPAVSGCRAGRPDQCLPADRVMRRLPARHIAATLCVQFVTQCSLFR